MIDIVTTTIEHLKELDQNIREKDKQEALNLGVEPLKALIQCHKYAVLRNTILINGRVAAVFGVTGNLFSEEHTLYLITSEVVTEIPHITFVRTYIHELEKLLSIFDKLNCYVDAEYKEAIKLLEFVGFRKEQTLILNDHEFYYYKIDSNGY